MKYRPSCQKTWQLSLPKVMQKTIQKRYCRSQINPTPFEVFFWKLINIEFWWILEVFLRQDVFCRFHNRSGSFLHMDFTNCQKLDWEVSPSNKAPTERHFGCFPIDLFIYIYFERSSILSFKGCPNNEIKNLYNTHAKGRTYLLFSILLRFYFKHNNII